MDIYLFRIQPLSRISNLEQTHRAGLTRPPTCASPGCLAWKLERLNICHRKWNKSRGCRSLIPCPWPWPCYSILVPVLPLTLDLTPETAPPLLTWLYQSDLASRIWLAFLITSIPEMLPIQTKDDQARLSWRLWEEVGSQVFTSPSAGHHILWANRT